VREGVVVAIVTQKRMPEPPPRVWSKGGDGGCCHHPEKNTEPLHSHLEQGRGWGLLLLPRKEYRTPPLAFEAREGVVVAIVAQKRMPEPPFLAFGVREGMLWSLIVIVPPSPVLFSPLHRCCCPHFVDVVVIIPPAAHPMSSCL
jgi:hypothetical protein